MLERSVFFGTAAILKKTGANMSLRYTAARRSVDERGDR